MITYYLFLRTFNRPSGSSAQPTRSWGKHSLCGHPGCNDMSKGDSRLGFT